MPAAVLPAPRPLPIPPLATLAFEERYLDRITRNTLAPSLGPVRHGAATIDFPAGLQGPLRLRVFLCVDPWTAADNPVFLSSRGVV